MKIFLSYGHDSNAPLIDKIYEYLTKGIDGSQKHEVWIDKSKIKAGEDWRSRIYEGIRKSDLVLAGLSMHSMRKPGVCRNEINISVGVMGGNIKTILLEPADVVAVPAMLSHIQWLDMSDWKQHVEEGFDSEYFKLKFEELEKMIVTPENERFNGDINLLKEKLCPISSMARIQGLTQERMYGRQWLYEKIEEWDKADEQRIFWIVGGPGFGKSMFSANLQQTYNAKIPAIQFVEWGKPIHSNSCGILRNLAFQLAVRYHDYLKQLLELPQLDKLLELNEYELFDVLFCESMFLRIDGGHENIWILIDALDEANDENGNKIAQTIARHVDRLPKWIKFILTSRNDSKVRLPLQDFKPQVVDLESSVIENNIKDIIGYVSSELSYLHLSDLQHQRIANKSEGVFLYAKLIVNDIKAGVYSVDELDGLPNGINSYYYALFVRLFQDDMTFYNEDVSRVLEIMVSPTKIMHSSLVRECAQVESDKVFRKILVCLQHLIKDSNNELTFFHNSLRDWLTDPNLSGCFYVSSEDGMRKICKSFVRWISCDDTTYDAMWQEYRSGFEDCFKNDISLPEHFSSSHINAIFYMLCPMECYAYGEIVQSYYNNLSKMKVYLDDVLYQVENEDYIKEIFVGLFESVKDMYIQIGIVSAKTRMFEWPDTDDYNPDRSVYDTIRKSAYFSAIVEYVLNKRVFSVDTSEKLIDFVEILAFYNRRLGEFLIGIVPSLSDMADFTASEMKKRCDCLKECYARIYKNILYGII